MNFALILFLLTLVTGVVWLADKLVFERRRRVAAADAVADFDRSHVPPRGEAVERQRAETEAQALREPSWIEYPKSFFPVLLIVFLLRSFLAEPFRIPSSSMRPTLVVGDYILVNKFIYGLRLPIIEKKIVPISDPERGDVVVFRYPVNPSQDFIKRVVGVGGDRIAIREGHVVRNGERQQESFIRPCAVAGADCEFPNEITVPKGSIYVLGDNRGASDDSRFWGPVPRDWIIGNAFATYWPPRRIGLL